MTKGRKSYKGSTLWWKKYNKYLQSKEWKELRKRALERDKYRCVRCGKKLRGKGRIVQVHHVSYSGFNLRGRSKLSEVISLCYSCHKKEHRR